MSYCRQQERGFSLLEVLVAFSILSISLGVLLQTFALGLRNTSLADDYTQATMHAESVMATIGVEQALEIGAQQDSINDKFFWRSSIELYVLEEKELDSNNGIEPYRVLVEVSWENAGKTRSVVLESLRLAVVEDF